MIHSAWARWRAFTLARAGRAQCTPVLGIVICAAIAAVVCWHYRHGIITGVKITAAVLACAAVIFLLLRAAAAAAGYTAGQAARRRDARRAAEAAAAMTARAAAMPAPVTAGADGHLDPAVTADRFELSADGVTTLPAGHPGPVTP